MNAKPAISLKILAERKTDGVQKTTQFQVDPRIIEVEDGFNARPIDHEHVAAFQASILAGATIPALFVRVDGGRVIIVDGHHRHAAYMALISAGHDIKRVDCTQFRGSDADRIAHMLTSAQGKALTPLQMGVQYRNLARLGWSAGEIAAKIGKSRQHVSDMTTLAESESDVTGMVTRGEVAANIAVREVKKSGAGAGAVLAGHLQVARESGKKKITAKTMQPSSVKKQDFKTVEELRMWLAPLSFDRRIDASVKLLDSGE
jgi:ParB-like chromosome segregation protein Spo0J